MNGKNYRMPYAEEVTGQQASRKWKFIWENSLWLFFILAAFSGRFVEVSVYMAAIIFHELVHVISALGFGFRLEEMRLLPIGGVVRFERRLEDNPFAQAVIALAGPAHNFIMVFMVELAKKVVFPYPYVFDVFLKANLALGIVNLLPIIPLDGGRVIHMYLTARLGWQQGRIWAYRIGRLTLGIIIIFMIAGYLCGFWNLTWIVWCIFLWWALEQERLKQFFQYWRMATAKKDLLQKKGFLPLVSFAVSGGERLFDVCQKLPSKQYHLLILLDEKAEKIKETLPELTAVNLILNHGYHITMDQAVALHRGEKTRTAAK